MDPSLLTDDTCSRKERYKTCDCVLLQLLWVAQHDVHLTLQVGTRNVQTEGEHRQVIALVGF